jgi:hypothetical protein
MSLGKTARFFLTRWLPRLLYSVRSPKGSLPNPRPGASRMIATDPVVEDSLV